MFKKALLLALLSSLTLSATSMKERMFSEIDFMKGVFEVKYAPLKWKRDFANYDLDVESEQACSALDALVEPSAKDYHRILKRFFNATKDYHVGVHFYATEEASLPFLIRGSEGRYFFVFIDRDVLPYSKFPFSIGDEILEFGGRAVGEVIEELRIQELGLNTEETDQAIAELMLTNRRASNGDVVPQGIVEILGTRRGDYKPMSTTLTWYYVPERVGGCPKFKPIVRVEPNFSQWRLNPKETVKREKFFEKMMVYSGWNASHVGCSMSENRHSLGARSSYIPSLGKKMWCSKKDAVFDAYTFRTENGRTLGYIRIPHYMGDEDQVKEFCEVMKLFQERTEGLVIDQINNPGGSIFYLYALLANFATEGPMATPKHRLQLTQEEVYMAVSILDAMEGVTEIKQAKEVIGETLGGYPITMETVHLMRQFCNFILGEWASGKLYTDPTHLFGVDHIKRHPQGSYTKPVLLLTNSLDFSAGDFFPAVMQDNGRAKILGTRTAGAGGYVTGTNFPTQTGVMGFSLTGSIAERVNKDPIENLGVRPDIEYSLSAFDLQNNYAEYVDNIVASIEAML